MTRQGVEVTNVVDPTIKRLIDRQTKMHFNKSWSTIAIKEVIENFHHNIQATYKVDPTRKTSHFSWKLERC